MRRVFSAGNMVFLIWVPFSQPFLLPSPSFFACLDGMLVGLSYFRFSCMIVFALPYVIPVYSFSLTKGYFKTGVYRWEYIVTLLLQMPVSWLRHADIGNFFCFSFPILYREESSFYNRLDLGYFVSPFMYYL